MSLSGRNLNSNAATLLRLFGLLRPQWQHFFVALVALCVGSSINLLFPEVIRRVLQSNPRELTQRITQVALILVTLFAVQGLAFYFRSYFFGVVGQRVVNDIRRRLYESLIEQPVEFFDRMRSGDLVSRLNSDTLLLQDAVSLRLSVIIRYSVQVLVGIVLMSYISLTLTISTILILPLLVGLSLILGRRLRRISRAQQEELGKSAAVAHETFDSIRLVKAFNKESFEAERFEILNSKVLSLGIERAATSAFFSSFVSFLLNCSIIGVLLFGAHLVGSERLSIADLTAFLLYGVIVAVSFAFLAGGYAETIQSLGAADRIFEFLSKKPKNTALAHAKQLPIPSQGNVEFSSVSFKYPTRPEVAVLNNISFIIPAGRTTAVVGPSGAGKSTIVNLLLALYDCDEGSIKFDGIDIREVTPETLREKIALVPQEHALFATTIAENLRYGKQTATLEELRSVCAKTNMLSFIETLPQQFETPVGERGIQLSSGQKQRLAIARAMLRDPALLILDEATSALDSENEHLVQDALRVLLQNRTALVIAHRLSTIKSADKVIVLDRGTILQEGTHAVLSQQPGLYRQLVERQELVINSRIPMQA